MTRLAVIAIALLGLLAGANAGATVSAVAVNIHSHLGPATQTAASHCRSATVGTAFAQCTTIQLLLITMMQPIDAGPEGLTQLSAARLVA